MTLDTKIVEVWCDVNIAYHRYHALHLNIVGRTFPQDHSLLEGLYEDAFEEIDRLGEIIRTLDITVPTSVREILATTELNDEAGYELSDAVEVVEYLIADYRELESVSGEETQISNHCQDRVATLKKQLWMLRSTI